MTDINVSLAIREAYKGLNQVAERYGEISDVWPITFFKPSGKWAYNDFVVMKKPDKWVDFDVLINDALRDTPREIRETNIGSIDYYWTVVMLENPLGFPIMVRGYPE